MQIAESATTDNLAGISLSVPAADGLTPSNTRITTGDKPLLIEKGSTEVLNINYQIDFVTNRDEIIIGSAMAKNFVLGTQTGHGAKLYLLPEKISKYAAKIDTTGAQEMPYSISSIITSSLYIDNMTNTTENEYSAYAFVDGQTNELLFGANKAIAPGQTVFTDELSVGLSITLTHNI